MPRKTSPEPEVPYRISPSVIARYFFQDCARFLRYSASSAGQRKRDGVPVKEFDHSPLMQAIFDSGYAWEAQVLQTYLKNRVHIAPGDGDVHTRRFGWQETLELLRTAKPGTYLYQPTLRMPAAFYAHYGLDQQLLAFSDNHPDLIAVLPDGAGGRVLRILDLKRGDSLKLTHRVQVLLYALELSHIAAEQNWPKTRVDLELGGVWLGGQAAPLEFALDELRPHLEAFLRDRLQEILLAEVGEVPWHVYFRCEWCEYFQHCHQEMQATNDVSRLAYLSTYGKRHLTEQLGIRTLPELATFLKLPEADEELSRCASLTGERPYLTKQIQAFTSGEPQLHGAASAALPRGENLALFLTLQQEPLGQQVYLAGAYLRGKPEVLERVLSARTRRQFQTADGKLRPWVAVAATPQEVTRVQAAWIKQLHQLLVEVDRYNRNQSEWREQVSLQAYVHSAQENALLVALLMDALHQPGLAEAAMTLLFYFQAPDLILADQHPAEEVAYPLVVLLDALGKLLALPVDVSYTLPETLAALGSRFNYQRSDYYHFPLGHGLRAEAIHASWYRGRSDQLPNLQKQAEMHLYAVSALLSALRDKAQEMLFAWPPKFVLPSVDDYGDPLLSRLAFLTRYEGLLRCLEMREARSESRETQALLGQVLELQAVNETQMKVIGNGAMEVEESDFPQYLLVPDSDAGRRAQLEYRDYLCRSQPWRGEGHPHRAVVGLAEVDEDDLGFPLRLTLNYRKPFANQQPQRGQRFLLYPRFSDYTTDRILGFLRQHVAQEGLFLKMLRSPAKASTKATLPQTVEDYAARMEKHLKLTPSQLDAYRAIRTRRFVPVWGPPGTGKTHFLAAMILGLTAAHAQAGKPFRVLISAFTHAAIENVLRKLADLQRQHPAAAELVLGRPNIGKGTSWRRRRKWMKTNWRAGWRITRMRCSGPRCIPVQKSSTNSSPLIWSSWTKPRKSARQRLRFRSAWWRNGAVWCWQATIFSYHLLLPGPIRKRLPISRCCIAQSLKRSVRLQDKSMNSSSNWGKTSA